MLINGVDEFYLLLPSSQKVSFKC